MTLPLPPHDRIAFPQISLANMAGKLGAKIPLPLFFVYKLTHKSPLLPQQISFSTSPFRRFSSSTLKMALENPTNGSPDIKEPVPKIQKTHQNGSTETTPISLPLLKVKKLSEKAVLPSRGSALSAGYDLSSATETKVPARGKGLVPTDLSIAIPEGTYGRVAPRSGLAWKHSIDVGAGVIDADYRGPVGVVLYNHSGVDFEVKVGDRIAQLILEKIITPEVLEIEDLDATVRGAGGFGSTGV